METNSFIREDDVHLYLTERIVNDPFFPFKIKP